MPSPNLFIAVAAGRTDRIRLGNMVNVLPFRNPTILAEEIAMLDNLTRGRLDVGIGRGLKPPEFETFGLNQEVSRAMFLEALEVMQGIWRDENFFYQGRYISANKTTKLTPPMVQQPHPPLYISAQSEKSLRWAAERDLPFSQIDTRIDECRRYQSFYKNIQSASDFPHTPRLFLTREIYLAPTDAVARSEAFSYLRRHWDIWGRYSQFAEEGRLPDSYDVWWRRAPELHRLSYDELIKQNLIFVGSPESVARQIEVLQTSLDVSVLLCVFHLSSLPHGQVTRSMRLFADEVLPMIRQTESAAI